MSGKKFSIEAMPSQQEMGYNSCKKDKDTVTVLNNATWYAYIEQTDCFSAHRVCYRCTNIIQTRNICKLHKN